MSLESIDTALGIAGAVTTLGLCATGSALGVGRAAAAAIGAWKKCYAQGKSAPYILLSYVGAPLTQTLYGMILMFVMTGIVKNPHIPGSGLAVLILGVFAGLGIGFSAWLQGIAGAGAADAQGETGSGLTNNLAALGTVETVAIFTMVFTLIAAGNLKMKADDTAETPDLPVAIGQTAD